VARLHRRHLADARRMERLQTLDPDRRRDPALSALGRADPERAALLAGPKLEAEAGLAAGRLGWVRAMRQQRTRHPTGRNPRCLVPLLGARARLVWLVDEAAGPPARMTNLGDRCLR